MRAEVVHEQVVSVVDEEVERVDHLSVVANQWHLDGLLNDLGQRLLCLLLLLEKLHLHLLLGLFHQELSLSDDLLTFLESFLDLICLLEHADVVPMGELVTLLVEELGASLCPLVQLLGLELHIDEVGVFEEARELV